MHIITFLSNCPFHISDFITQSIFSFTCFNDFLMTIFSKSYNCFICTRIFINFNISFIKCSHTSFWLFRMKSKGNCSHFICRIHQKNTRLFIYTTWRKLYLRKNMIRFFRHKPSHKGKCIYSNI